MITIRPRRDSDLAGCVATLRMVHSLSGYPVDGVEDALGFLWTDDRAWVATRDADGAILGHAALSKPDERSGHVALWRQLHPPDFGSGSGKDDIVVLGRLFVHPEARGGGVATRLIDTGGRGRQEEGRQSRHAGSAEGPGRHPPVLQAGLGALRDYGL
ncbi:hypothetical protein DL769_004787 [Monosporascus sp. CRB-8-3]|nr:hypothetical protein DL769_004787 [Monosporascus sp. CRB-8-3]